MKILLIALLISSCASKKIPEPQIDEEILFNATALKKIKFVEPKSSGDEVEVYKPMEK